VFLYNVAIQAYLLGIRLVALRGGKARRWLNGRKNLFEQIRSSLKPGEKRIWVHCASVGEFEQGRPVIERLKQQYPEHQIVLTFFSPSGYELRKNYAQADYVFYLPPDTARNAARFIDLLSPELALFVKYEFWYHYLSTLQRRQVPVLLISAIFRPDQFFFRWFGRPFLPLLRSFRMIFVQDEASIRLLQEAGVQHIQASHDTRFDRVHEIALQPKSFPVVDRFCADNKILVCGSTWEADEHIIIRWINEEMEKKPDWKVIIVPHEINDKHIVKMLGTIRQPVLLYSHAGETKLENWRVLIVDKVGMLSSLYKKATLSYIGGGFGSGIHNILEAAVYGHPVLFGPRHRKFHEAKELIQLGGAFSVSSYGKFLLKFFELTGNEAYLQETSLTARTYIERHLGATAQITDYIGKEVFKENGAQ